MVLSLVALCVSAVSVVISTAFNLKGRIGKFKFHLYWVVPLIFAVILLSTQAVPVKQLGEQFFGDSRMNPLKILSLFLSMSTISIYLDKVGFFKYIAAKVLRHAGSSQIKLFILLYFIISAVTLFTSNSTIVLTFTPFICYFAKNSGINPVPYIFMEFVAANTWSMFFIIGNVTNIYISTSFGVTFVEFLQVMAIPAIFAAVTSFCLLLVMFRKDLKEPLAPSELEITIRNKPAFAVGVAGLAVCTVMLAVSSYVGLEMWYIALASATAVVCLAGICFLAKKQSLHPIAKTFKRLPWHLVPFLISMFVIVLGLGNYGITDKIAGVFDNKYALFSFGSLTAVSANLMNNQPMSMFFVGILSSVSEENIRTALFSSVVGSNIGSLFTPAASMSGIMWLSILKHKGVDFKFFDFVKRGFLIAVPVLFASLGGLALVLSL